MTQEEMLLLVPRKLKEIEEEYHIRVLYAAESGSRAWGTAAEESDFDVRFIYIRPREEYLRLDPNREVLEFPIEESWDMCGWDLDKTLRLLRSSNSQIYEWFCSPVVYLDAGFSQRFAPLLAEYFSVKTCANHYLHQTELKMKRIWKSEEAKVKHYLYSLQYLSSSRWVLDHQEPVPVSFTHALERLPENIRKIADALILQKTQQHQLPLTPHIPELEDYLKEEYARLDARIRQLPAVPDKDWQPINRFFLQELEG